jgi:hypothetical protein
VSPIVGSDVLASVSAVGSSSRFTIVTSLAESSSPRVAGARAEVLAIELDLDQRAKVRRRDAARVAINTPRFGDGRAVEPPVAHEPVELAARICAPAPLASAADHHTPSAIMRRAETSAHRAAL